MNAAECDRIEESLVSGIRDFAKTRGFKRAHLGFSGGLDSALVAYLAVKAMGAENLTGISMPSRFTSQQSKDDAARLAANLGCCLETLPIEECFTAFLSTLKDVFKNTVFDLTEENLQARIRGVLLMAYSNKFSSMLFTTGNKSEISMGYCTLYGDTCGALAPIGDLFKTEVYALCRRINERAIAGAGSGAGSGREVIPQAIIDKPPSAELRENQKDTDSLPPYDVLDAILELHLCSKVSRDGIIEKGWDVMLVDRILDTVARMEFKRSQLPPYLNKAGIPVQSK